MNRIKILIAMLMGVVAAWGHDGDTLATVRPVYSAYMLDLGSAHIADTYLTPLHYRGAHGALAYQRSQAMRWAPESWAMQLSLSASLDHTQNPARNATMLSALVDASWRMWHKWAVTDGLSVGLGPGARINAGALYLNRNGNNPASAKAAVTLDACGYASYKLKLWGVPVTLRYQLEMPLIGTFFQPNYGQLYYQIYLGDHQQLAHCAWPGSYFMLDNLLTADINLGSVSLRIGYHGNVLSTKANNIVGNIATHAVTIGITTEWISLRPGNKLNEAKIIRYDDAR